MSLAALSGARHGCPELGFSRHATIEADHLLAAPAGKLSHTDRLRLMAWPALLPMFLYTLLIKCCLRDGWPGWLYVLQRTPTEAMIAIEIAHRRLRVAAD
jgi:hypothetical protein